jgi:hypothetical protein
MTEANTIVFVVDDDPCKARHHILALAHFW